MGHTAHDSWAVPLAARSRSSVRHERTIGNAIQSLVAEPGHEVQPHCVRFDSSGPVVVWVLGDTGRPRIRIGNFRLNLEGSGMTAKAGRDCGGLI
jgi:hypothetical protein